MVGTLIDSNILIYWSKRPDERLRPWIVDPNAYVAEITWLEVLGYHRLGNVEEAVLRGVKDDMHSLATNWPVIEEAIHLRQQRRISLGDAIVAGTALLHGLTLATHNSRDFAWIDGLEVADTLTNPSPPPQP